MDPASKELQYHYIYDKGLKDYEKGEQREQCEYKYNDNGLRIEETYTYYYEQGGLSKYKRVYEYK